MKLLALIFFACVFEAIQARSVEDAMQEGHARIAQLKKNWESQTPEIGMTILPELQKLIAQFTEVATRVNKEVAKDAAKAKAAENVKVAYDTYMAETIKAVTTIAGLRPGVLEKAFGGDQLATAGYQKVSEMINELKKDVAGNACKENVFNKFAELAEQQVAQMTDCVVEGGSNFPVIPNDIRQLRVTAQKVTKDDMMVFQRCPEEPGTICFENLVVHLEKETQFAKRNADSYVDAPHMEVDMQKTVTQHCVKRRAGFLKKQVPEFKKNMDKC